jgi:hypothetical protein
VTTDHVFYIPLMLLAGLVIGLFLGRRSVAVDQDEDVEREARREARRQRLAELAAQSAGEAE